MVFKLQSKHNFLTDKIPREVTKSSMQEIWFLCSAHHLMLTDINMQFPKDILSGFQVTEWKQICVTDNVSREITHKIHILREKVKQPVIIRSF